MAFRRKFRAVLAFEPDILIIPESESPDYLLEKREALPWRNHIWIGENRTKGLSVFARRGLRLRLAASHRKDLRFIAPVEITGPGLSFVLFGVWTQGHRTPSKSYVQHSLNALRVYSKTLDRNCIWAGDFNSNPVFRNSGKKHLEMVATFENLGLSSAYHEWNDERHGMETQPSFFLHRDPVKPYHLDYLFCRSDRVRRVALGQPDDWLGHSDHMPLVVDLAKT